VVLDANKGAQIHVVLEGRNNGAMPAWKQLSDTEIAAVITYTKNNWSNKTGQLVQPADVAAIRAGKELAPSASSGAAPAAPAAATAAAPAAEPAIASTGLPISVLFASGKSALDPEAAKAVAAAAAYLKSKSGGKVALSGYVDSSGDAAKNVELAKERAKSVRAALEKAGITQDRIEMRKPQEIEAGGAASDRARRVDIVSAS
jgi:cytochrome c oxidase subunit 2